MAKNGKKILVVEDDKFLIKAYNIKFTKEGFNVVTAMDGVSGLDLSKSELPKLILLDLMLPKIDGFEFLKRMKQDEKIKNISSSLVSLYQESHLGKKDFQIGLEQFILNNLEK